MNSTGTILPGRSATRALQLAMVLIIVGCGPKPMNNKTWVTMPEPKDLPLEALVGRDGVLLKDENYQVLLLVDGQVLHPFSKVKLIGIIQCQAPIDEHSVVIDVESDAAMDGPPTTRFAVKTFDRDSDVRYHFVIADCLGGRALKKGSRFLSVKLTIADGATFSTRLPFEVRDPDPSVTK